MAQLSNKENLMLVLNKQIPESIPRYSIFWGINGSPSILRGKRDADGVGFDPFGVEWVIDDSAFKAALPKPGVFILDDIRKWRDVIKAPDFKSLDWEAMAKEDLANHDPELPLGGRAGVSFFQSLMNFMGFTEGLMACFEEPEEVKALMEYLCDWSCELAKIHIQTYKPQYAYYGDDIAHERDPFVSLPVFRDLFAPYWRKFIGVYLNEGIPGAHHNCGHFELFADDLADMGFTLWEPVQNSNDRVALKAKFGRELALCGAMDFSRFADPKYPATEEEIRAALKDELDIMAPGGGFAFQAFIGGLDPEISAQRNAWLNDEFEKLKGNYS